MFLSIYILRIKQLIRRDWIKIKISVDKTTVNIDNEKLKQQIDNIADNVAKELLKDIPKYHNTNPHFQSCKNIFKEYTL